MKVLVSVPCQPPWIHKLVVFVLLKLQMDRRHKLRIILPTHTPFENSLHHIVNDFMRGGEDFWLTIDADNPPLNNPLDLVDLNLSIIGLPTPVWHHTGADRPGELSHYWNAYKFVPGGKGYAEWPEKKGLQEVDAVGTGCVLMARRVFENPEMRKAPFQRTYYEDGTVNTGNDIAFCERAKAQGFGVWAHYDYPCQHVKDVPLTDVIEMINNLRAH